MYLDVSCQTNMLLSYNKYRLICNAYQNGIKK